MTSLTSVTESNQKVETFKSPGRSLNDFPLETFKSSGRSSNDFPLETFKNIVLKSEWCVVNNDLDWSNYPDIYEFRTILQDNSCRFIGHTFDVCQELYRGLLTFSEKINYMYIDGIDRGIEDFPEFGDSLLELHPDLKVLVMSQNYSYDNDITDEQFAKDFIGFIKSLKLSVLIFYDSQSQFWTHLTLKDILDAQPDNSLYCICSGTSLKELNKENKSCLFKISDKNKNKYLYFTHTM